MKEAAAASTAVGLALPAKTRAPGWRLLLGSSDGADRFKTVLNTICSIFGFESKPETG